MNINHDREEERARLVRSGSPSLDDDFHINRSRTMKERFINFIEKFGPYDPTSLGIRIWNFIILFWVMYNAFMIPILFAFRDLWAEGSVHYHILFYTLDYVGDLFFIADILLNFRMTYMDYGIVHTDTKQIAKRYWKTKFFKDALASLPLSLFGFSHIWLHALLRIPRLLRFNRVLEYFAIWELLTQYSHTFLFIKLFGGIMLYLHWVGCFYMSISYYSGFTAEEEGWPPSIDDINNPFWSLYLIGVFWAIKCTTGLGGEVGPPDTDLQRFYSFVIATLSMMISGFLIGSLVDVISTANQTSDEFRTKMANLNTYMRNKKLPSHLTQKIRNYYKHLWSRQGGIDDESVLGELPSRLRTEVALQINGTIINKVPFFKNCNPGFIHQLVGFLRPEIYTPGDTIITEGDVGTEMYFISQGQVEIYSSTGFKINLGESEFFGEIALVTESKRTASAKAKTYCDIFVLRKSDLDKTLKNFPEQRAIIRDRADERMTKDLLRKSLSSFYVFQNRNEVDKLKDSFQVEIYSAGDIIYNIGDPSDRIYFAGLGELLFFNSRDEILESVKSEMDKGYFFGETEFFLDKPRTKKCKAVSRCLILTLDRESFDTVFEPNSPAFKQMEITVKQHEPLVRLDDIESPVTPSNKEKEPKKPKQKKEKKEKSKESEWLSKFKQLIGSEPNLSADELADIAKSLLQSM